MVSEEMDLVSSQRMEKSLNSQMVFQEENLQFNCGAPQRQTDSDRKTRVLTGFDEKMFSVDRERFYRPQPTDFRRNIYCSENDGREGVPGDSDNHRNRPEIRLENQNWNADRNGVITEGSTGTQSEGTDGDEEEEDDDDEDDDEGDGEVEGLVTVDEPQESIAGISAGNDNNKNNNSSSSVQSHSERNRKVSLDRGNNADKTNFQSSFGFGRDVLMKDHAAHSVNNIRGCLNEHQQSRMPHCVATRYDSAIAVAEPDNYYSQILQGSGTPLGQKELGGDNGTCGFSGRKDITLSIESGDSLMAILSDPITGALMDDAFILNCGHSFGGGGIHHVISRQACYTCGHPISEDQMAPNLSLRSAVQAFRREEELQSSRASKRRRDRFEQEKCSYGDMLPLDFSRGKGVQFPFVVTDRVIIKGNKRTPQRFVGREAVVTTQCLNGWYVVKTLDNAESVKLQYRSLSKVPDNQSSTVISNKSITPNWL